MQPMRFLLLFALTATTYAADLRLGIVGTDTSHATAFTEILNNPASKNHIPGARVVAAYPGGSRDLPDSWDRVDKFASELRTKYGVELVRDIATLCRKVDAVLLESVDGRPHLEQARLILAHRKPMFIDKPLSATLQDAREIARLAREAGVPWFSSSALRFSDGLPALRLPGLNGVIAWGPGPVDARHTTELTWYGIHTVEILYSLLGTGCTEVTNVSSSDADVITGKWKDGRVGTIRVNRPYSAFGAAAFSKDKVVQNEKDLYTGYRALVAEIVKFFQTGKPPVAEEETLEMFEFMDAAQRSKAAGGQPVRLR